jgi:hypothetical protein
MAQDTIFSGRVLAIWSKEPARGGVFENVCLRKLDQRAFLVGQLADDGQNDPRVGATFWFPLDDVLMLTEYADVQAARTAYAAREKENAAERPRKPRWQFWS